MSDLEKAKILTNGTLRQAMAAIDAGTAGVALVTDTNAKLVGILTDGDLRRALLGGAEMNDKIEHFIRPKFIFVKEGTSRADVLDLMKAHEIEQVPVLDSEDRLVGWHLVSQMISNSNLPNCAVVMAGGKGTRLGAITKNVPKPMLKVAGRPILERIVFQLVGAGIKTIYLSVNHYAEQIEAHFGDGKNFGCEIKYLREKKPLGSGGSLSLLPEQDQASPVLVMNGDLVTDFDFRRIIEFHERSNSMGTVGLEEYSHRVPYGCVRLNDSVITELCEKPLIREVINAGIYVLSPELVKRVEKRFFPITDLFEDCIKNKEQVTGYMLGSDWVDVGQPEDLQKACEGS